MLLLGLKTSDETRTIKNASHFVNSFGGRVRTFRNAAACLPDLNEKLSRCAIRWRIRFSTSTKRCFGGCCRRFRQPASIAAARRCRSHRYGLRNSPQRCGTVMLAKRRARAGAITDCRRTRERWLECRQILFIRASIPADVGRARRADALAVILLKTNRARSIAPLVLLSDKLCYGENVRAATLSAILSASSKPVGIARGFRISSF